MLLKFFEHQQLVLDQTFDKDRVAYYLDMGLGKTFIGAEKLWQLNLDYNLVICQKSQIKDWMEHFERYYPEYKVIRMKNEQTFEKGAIYIINYESAWRRKQLLKLRGYTLLLDESSKIKNDKSKVAKFMMKLEPSAVILLSGTPTGGKYEELWTQARLLGWDIKKWDFLTRYTIQVKNQNWGGYTVVGYRNVEELKAKFREHGAVFMKSDEWLNLPEKMEIEVVCENTKYYKEFMRHSYLNLNGVEYVGDNALNERLYARQLAGHLNPNKMTRLKDLIESTEDRLLIFYNWTIEYDMIRELCEKLNRPVSVIRGGVVDKKNYEECSNSITLIQYQAGAMGHNLQKANKIVYFTLPDKSIAFEQSKKRIHRIGQSETCFYYYLLTESSVEYSVKKALEMRRDYTNELFKLYKEE